MADAKPLKLVDQGGGAGRLAEFETGDTLPKAALPALSAADVGAVAAGDPRLSDAREWSAQTVDQTEAEAGTANTRRAWTAQRVRQAIVAWWNGISSAWGRGFVASADAAAGRTALGLGSAATATLQQSNTDNSVGAVLRHINAIGPHGLGGNPIQRRSLAQINLDRGCEFFDSNLATSENPFGNAGAGLHLAYPAAQRWGQLFFKTVGVSTVSVWVRSAIGSNPLPPVELWHTSNLTPNVLAAYTLATLPNAAANPRLQAWCSNLTGGAMPVYSDGADWRRTFDNSIAN